jgi:hypothetical protein
MKLAFRSCMACGFEGHESQVRLVVVEVPVDERVPVTVAIAASFREGAVEELRVVPGRYAAELRCTDVGACRLRVAALTDEQRGVAPAPVAADVDDVSAWMP